MEGALKGLFTAGAANRVRIPRRPIRLVLAALLFPAAIRAVGLGGGESGGSVVDARGAGIKIKGATYRSAAGELLKATFDLGRNLVRLRLPDGRRVTLPAATSASGARYSNGSRTFWEHQGVGRYFEGETPVFQGEILRESPRPNRR